MSSKWKYFVKKYQNFCIASGIVGFLLAPFLWPFFLAIGEYLVPDSTSSAGVLGDSPAEKEARRSRKRNI